MKVYKLLADYLFLSKKIETESDNRTIRVMHRINRISLLLFLFSLMVMVSKMITQVVLSHCS